MTIQAHTFTKALIIHTGGTIGMVPSSNGLMPKKNRLKHRCRELFTEFEFDWVELEPLIDSSALTLSHWQALISTILTADTAHYSRIIILHGTDSLSYTAAALTLTLLNQTCPAIIITGAQKSIFEQNSDAYDNIYHALTCLLNQSQPPGVQVSFNQTLIKPMSCYKRHTEAFNGFSARQPSAPTIKHPFIHTDFSDDFIQIELCQPALMPRLNKHAKAVVLLAYGSGNLPPTWNDFLQQCQTQNIPLILTSQVEQGGLALTRYNTQLSLSNSPDQRQHIAIFCNNYFSLAATLTSIRYCLASNQDTKQSLSYLFDQILL
jgi:L-asparaginase